MKPTIMIADDVSLNVDMLMDIFEDEYDILTAMDGNEADALIHTYENRISAVLLDVNMPGKSGIDLLSEIKHSKDNSYLPVLMITTDCSSQMEQECLELGATDFIKKPFNPLLVKTRVRNSVNLFRYQNHLSDKLNLQNERLKRTNRGIVELLGNLVESRNLESGEHVQRVSSYTRALAYEMMKRYPEYGLDEEMVEIIADSAALHDIGKISIPDSVLLKPGKLTSEEFEIMKTHTTQGSEYIKDMIHMWAPEYVKAAYDIARYHHERYDGRGYPEGLKQDEIPISAQLVSIADVFDALIHERCYKKAFPLETAKEMIVNGDCGVFSPKLIECFLQCYPFETIQ